jgi:hypothetical protein
MGGGRRAFGVARSDLGGLSWRFRHAGKLGQQNPSVKHKLQNLHKDLIKTAKN